MTVLPQVGAYPLTSVKDLPNADIAFPGEVWTNQRAAGEIVPGSAVVPVNASGVLNYKAIETADMIDQRQVAIGLRQIMIPDTNVGSLYSNWFGPNEIVNLLIPDQEYVRTYHTGVLHLTLVVPDNTGGYVPSELIGWDPDGVRPTGKATGTGAWTHAADGKSGTDVFECREWRPYGTAGEGVLTVRYLRANQ